ncbi:MAG: hypothetical protein ABI867_38630 [Kofleriaceae bacterium]
MPAGEELQLTRVKEGPALTKRKRTKIVTWTACVAVGAALGLGFSTTVALLVVGVGFAGSIVVQLIRFRRLMGVLKKIQDGDGDGADAILARLPKYDTGMSGSLRALADGLLLAARGDPAAALPLLERAHALAHAGIRMVGDPALVVVYAQTGDVERAKHLRATLQLPERLRRRPDVQFMFAVVDLEIAVAAGTQHELDAATLEQWGTLALASKNSRSSLVALGQIYAARADEAAADRFARAADAQPFSYPLEPPRAEWLALRLAAMPPIE